ncbi:MAG: hypothetical protein HYZ53_17655 [Planctomycetes bacterium]|nr:hypothetical protein [Planctomycetota bacterium]
MPPFLLPPDYARIQRVRSFHELLTTPLTGGVNALCWDRELPGNFSEVVEQLAVGEGTTTLEDARLETLPVSAAGRVAIDILLADQRLLREQGLFPELDCVRGYARDQAPGPVPTDVYSFHVDSATDATDTWLCTYSGPASEGLRNDEARRHVDIPETRAELLRRFGGEDNNDFLEYLSGNCYDLHYLPVPQARPFSFGVGNLWRIAVAYPGNPVPPFIHRAPATLPGQPPRLLLIS